MSIPLTVSVEHRGTDTAVITVAGELDVLSAPILHNAITTAFDNGYSRLVIDAAGLGFCDSQGLWVLIQAARRTADRGGSLRLAAPTPFLRRLLTVTHVGEAIPVDADVAAALDALP
jgi:anti-sigma B factor antagonist/stage II sporulation protein AA (anti-sigma F factor antagonist)